MHIEKSWAARGITPGESHHVAKCDMKAEDVEVGEAIDARHKVAYRDVGLRARLK
jgi:hypothetical protein